MFFHPCISLLICYVIAAGNRNVMLELGVSKALMSCEFAKETNMKIHLIICVFVSRPHALWLAEIVYFIIIDQSFIMTYIFLFLNILLCPQDIRAGNSCCWCAAEGAMQGHLQTNTYLSSPWSPLCFCCWSEGHQGRFQGQTGISYCRFLEVLRNILCLSLVSIAFLYWNICSVSHL